MTDDGQDRGPEAPGLPPHDPEVVDLILKEADGRGALTPAEGDRVNGATGADWFVSDLILAARQQLELYEALGALQARGGSLDDVFDGPENRDEDGG
jgi:hypothetical protein